MFIYYSSKNDELNNYDFKFSVEDSIVTIHVSNNESISDKKPDYFLIRVQAPSRGIWPNSSVLYLDGIEIERILS